MSGPRTGPGIRLARVVSRALAWARSVLRPSRLRQEMDEEISFHIASRAGDLQREGLPAAEALRQARVEFGAQASHRDGMRAALGLGPVDWLAELAADLRYGFRLLRKNPGFTATAVCSLGLAIGANAAIFSTANELLFARLGVPRAAELREVLVVQDEHGGEQNFWNGEGSAEGGKREFDVLPYPAFQQLASQAEQTPLFGYQDVYNITLSGAGDARAVNVEMVSGSYYGEMEVRPALGRALLPADDRVDAGAPLAVVLSHGLWQRVFGGTPDVLGRTIRLEGTLATVVGVNPRGFTGAGSVQISPDVFVPLTAVSRLKPLIGIENPLHSEKLSWVKAELRMQPGMSENQSAAGLTVALEARLRKLGGLKAGQTLPWVALGDGSRGVAWIREQYGKPVYALLGSVGLVLLLACVNVGNLMLARARTRGREMSLRLALGAGRARIFRQLLTEALLLSALGGVLGFLLAFLVRDVVPRLLWQGDARTEIQVSFDWRVFAFTAGVTVASAILAGLAPAWQATRRDPGEAIKDAGTGATGRRRMWGGKALVAVEVALALVLVASAGLFLRTMLNLERVNPGFQAKGLLLFEVNLPALKYPAGANRRMLAQLLEAVRSTPGVERASITTVAMLSHSTSDESFYLERPLGGKSGRSQDASVDVDSVTPGYFETMGIPIVAGRSFSDGDTGRTDGLALINQSMARKYFPGVNPIGRRFSSSGDHATGKATGTLTEVVGICGDTLYADPHAQPEPLHFDLIRGGDDVGGGVFVVRSSQRPEELVPTLRRVVARLDPDLPLTAVRTQEEQIAEVTQQERLMAMLSLAFGALALLLAGVGVYGVLSYSVTERTREIGIRLALGADRGRVQSMVLREAGWLAAFGVAAGLGATLALGSLVRALLFGIRPADPAALAGAAGALLLLALVAAWVPARRAARVEPIEALRHE